VYCNPLSQYLNNIPGRNNHLSQFVKTRTQAEITLYPKECVFENDEFADFNWKINDVSYDKDTNTGFHS
jgi:hypothetical protein